LIKSIHNPFGSIDTYRNTDSDLGGWNPLRRL